MTSRNPERDRRCHCRNARHPQDPSKYRSAIDFHILYDSSGPDLVRIRRELTRDDGQTKLVARPYLLRPDLKRRGRSWDDLVRRIQAVRDTDPVEESRRSLPSGMLHELREALFLGRNLAEARLKLVRERYQPHINPLLEDDSLFWLDEEIHRTGLQDAIDVAEFWEGTA